MATQQDETEDLHARDPAVQAAWEEAVAKELRRRMKVVQRIHDDPVAQMKVLRYLGESGADGLVAYARDWCWTYDPRNRSPVPKNCPLILWPRQEELLRALYETGESDQNLLIEKSRDTGVTWLIAGVYFTWRWRFTPGWAGAMGSRKEELLDRLGDPKTMFAKTRWVIAHVPRWMRPAGYNADLHSHFKRIVNPDNGASITGEAGPEMGRGGRASDYFLDEFGVMPRAQQVDAAVSGNSNHVIYAHTAAEPGVYMNQIRESGRARVFTLSWESDPRKDRNYRARFLAKYGPEITAKELDIDWSSSGGNAFIPGHYVRAAMELDLPSHGPCEMGVDVADSGTNESVVCVRRGPVVTRLDSWLGMDPVATAHRSADIALADKCSILRYDNIGVGAGMTGGLNQRSAKEKLEHVGVNVGTAPTGYYLPDAPRRQASDRFANLKAELWWRLRLRFENTWRRVVKGEDVPDEDCISIPADAVLMGQLSAPQIEHTETGKMKVESKASLKRRGIQSPDRADALVLAYADVIGPRRAPRFARI